MKEHPQSQEPPPRPELSFMVAATPVAQPRQRHGARATKSGGVRSFNYLDSEHPIHIFKLTVQQCARAALQGRGPYEGPLHLGVSFVLPRPKHPKKHGINRIPASKHVGDLDNFLKAVLDACNGILFEDDCQVTSCFMTKEEAAEGEDPHVLVVLQPVKWSPQLPGEDGDGEERTGE